LVENKGMTSATLTSKNQITVPEPIRSSMHLSKGDCILFEQVEQGWILRREPRELSRSDGAAKQWVRRKKAFTVEEMKERMETEAVQTILARSQ